MWTFSCPMVVFSTVVAASATLQILDIFLVLLMVVLLVW